MATSRSYTSLEPGFTESLGVGGLSYSTDNVASLFASSSFLYSFAIMLSVLAAGVMYARAGIWRMEASERGVRKSNEEIKRTTLGLLGVLSLFVIIYTFNKGLLTGDVGLDGLRAKSFVSGGGAPTPTSTPIPTTNGTEQANRQALSSNGITVNKNPCTAAEMAQSKPSCTNLTDIPQSVLSMLIQLKTTCPNSTVVVTGGTEPGHVSHGPGKSAVDLRIGTGALDTCIQKFNTGPTLNYCTATYTGLGFVFCNEKGTGHWHVFK